MTDIIAEPLVSEYTAEKLKHFKAIITMHIAITAAVLNKHEYWEQKYHYIDATAGPGLYPEGFYGSPIIFTDCIYGYMPCLTDFIEVNPQTAESLANTLLNHHNTVRTTNTKRLHIADYRERIPEILAERMEDEFGLLFIDPTGQLPDFDTLAFVARQRPRMEILLYISPVSAIKRQRHWKDERLVDYIAKVDKQYWLVREPSGQHQWTFLLGSNTSLFKDYSKIGFYRLDSAKGRAIFDVLNHTEEELKKGAQIALPLTEPMMNT